MTLLTQIGTSGIKDNAITTAKVAADAVTQPKIGAGAVGTTEIANNAVLTAKIQDGTIATADLTDGAVNMAKLATSGTLPALNGSALTGVGKVLQVKQKHINTTQSVASSSTSNFADFTGFNLDITPSATTSKILVMADVNYGINAGTIHFRLVRGSTAIAVHDTPGGSRIASTKNSRPEATPYAIYSDNLSMNFLDTPSTTSATTYKVQGTLGATYNSTMYLNRPYHMGDSSDYNGRGVSTLILMEIGQ